VAVSAFAGKPATSTQTGQGIGVNLRATGTFAAHMNETWRYDEAAATAYFTNTLTSGPVVSCTGSPTACGAANQPAAPAAPAADPGEVNGAPQGPRGAVDENKCNFLDGATLDGHTYTQKVVRNGLDGHGNFTFTWSYTVAPTVASVAPFTAWNLVDTHGSGNAHVTIRADIYGESAMQQAKMSGPKYSFSMVDALGSRVTNLVLTVDGAPNYLASSIVTNADFNYTTNAGSNGVTSLLKNGDARSILNNDVFAGNNNGGSDGSALAKAVMDAYDADFGPGFHTVTLTGTVKGNSIDGESTGANISFSVTQTVNVITPGCSGKGN